MMNISSLSARLMMKLGVVLAMLAARPVGGATPVYFDGSTSSDFNVATNWDFDTQPGVSAEDIFSIDYGLTATISSDTTTVGYLRVGMTDKAHQIFGSQFGRLNMTGGTLEVTGVNTLAVGRDNLAQYSTPLGADYSVNSFVDGEDFLIWQRGFGSNTALAADGDRSGEIDAADLLVWKRSVGDIVYGGEIIMTGDSILRANGVLIGERTRGTLWIGPDALVDIRIWDTGIEPNQFGGTEDMRVGTWGPAYETFGGEPGLNGIGLVDVRGALNAKDLYLSEHGAKSELRIQGGTVNLNGELIMNRCDGCVSDPALLDLRSSKVTIIGSGGTFNVGIDPDPLVVDTMPPPRSLLATTPTAQFSFTADAGGVTPIVVAQNVGEASGQALINTASLVLNLDAYTSNSPLTLINAPPLGLIGSFGSVTFVGHRTAQVTYDGPNGDVILTNFQSAEVSGVANSTAAPEPGSLLLAAVGSGLVAMLRVRQRRRSSQRGLPMLDGARSLHAVVQ